MLSVARVALAVALLVATAACSSSDDDQAADDTPASSQTATATDATPNAHVSLIQTRSKEGSRKIALRITNAGDGPFMIDAIRLV